MQIKEILKKGLDECCNIVFPKICLHCKEQTSSNFFCDNCISSFELLDAKDIKIFPNISYPVVATFEDIGAINTFFIELKKMAIPVFAKLAASYMVLQYLKLGSPPSDVIIPLSDPTFGVKYTDILAKEVAKLLERPVKKLFFHAKILALHELLFVRDSSLQDKSILIVIDKLDEKKISKAVSILEKLNFKKFRFLAFCQ